MRRLLALLVLLLSVSVGFAQDITKAPGSGGGGGASAVIYPPLVPAAGQAAIGNAGGTAYAPQTISCTGATCTLSSAGVLALSAIPNATLSNSSITLNAGTNVGLTTPGAVSLGGTGVIGNTSDKVQLGSLGLGVAAPTTVGLFSLTPAANATSAETINTWVAAGAAATALTVNAPTGATTNLAIATTGNASFGVLSPGVANRNMYISSGSGSVTLALDPVSAAGAGGAIQLYKSGTFTGGIYHESAYTGAGTSSDTSIIQGQGGGKIKLFPNGDTTPTLTAATSVIIAGRGDATATPTSATVRGPNADGSTSNVTGSGMTVQPGLNSGTAVPASINIQGGALGTASGATVHTAVSRHTINSTKILTNNSAIAIVNATVASNTVAMQNYQYGVEVFNGTDLQVENGFITCVVINKAGVFSGNTCTKSGNTQSLSAGTLTVTFAISGANPAVVSVNANSSLTPSAGYPRLVYEVANMSQNDIAIQ